MTGVTEEAGEGTGPITRDHVLRTALDVIDRDGVDGLSMRRLGRVLGRDPMDIVIDETFNIICEDVFGAMTDVFKEKYGADFYEQIGHKGGQKVKKLIADAKASAAEKAAAEEKKP